MAPTPKQSTLFSELLDRKQFPDGIDSEALKGQFANLSRATASNWIDKALALPNATDADDTGSDAPAPF